MIRPEQYCRGIKIEYVICPILHNKEEIYGCCAEISRVWIGWEQHRDKQEAIKSIIEEINEEAEELGCLCEMITVYEMQNGNWYKPIWKNKKAHYKNIEYKHCREHIHNYMYDQNIGKED